MQQAYTKKSEFVLEQLDARREGLNAEDVSSRLEKYGENTLPEAKPPALWKIFLHQFKDPLIYVLLIAGTAALAMQRYPSAIFIFIVLMINAIIGTIQEYSATRAAAALKAMATPKARVKRDGKKKEVDAGNLVPGDIVLLESGNKVPADCRLVECKNLKADESLLTGESEAVEKKADTTLDEDASVSDQKNMVFAGSVIINGRAEAVVVATGMETQMGDIAKHISEESATKSPLIIRMEKFTVKIAVVIAIAVICISAIMYVRGDPPQEIFLMAIGLAVSAIPAGLPVALTVALAIGMRRMAERNVIVRRLVAVEALGSCTMIASDKTGTLTRNEMTAERIRLPSGKRFDISTGDTAVDGTIEEATHKNDNVLEQHPALKRLLYAATLANEGEIEEKEGSWQGKGDAVDVALLFMAKKAGIDQNALHEDYLEKARIPYESEQKYAASFHNADDKSKTYVKGAVDTLLEMCSQQTGEKKDKALDSDSITDQENDLSGQQYRVLSFADGEVPNKEDYKADELKDLTFLGMVGLRDPIRSEVGEAIAQCKKAGIEVAMITGDHPDTAQAIAKELGLCEGEGEAVTGQKIKDVKEEELDELTRKTHVYARVEPKQKLDIIKSLARNGHFVAVTGDGVNDAPALKHAHVGVAMGKKGTDVAKESADIILTDDNFSSIVAGVEEGRVAYNNIRKIVFFLVSKGLSEVLLFIAAIAFGMGVPLFATQLLWLNFVTNGIQDVAHAFEPKDGDELKARPRNPNEAIFDPLMIYRVGLSGLIIFAISFAVFYFSQQPAYGGASIEEARNLTLLQLVLFGNVIALNSRSEHKSFFKQPFMKNPLLIGSIIIAQIIHIGAMYTPWISDVLHIQPVTLQSWGVLSGLALLLMVVLEVEKYIRRNWINTQLKESR